MGQKIVWTLIAIIVALMISIPIGLLTKEIGEEQYKEIDQMLEKNPGIFKMVQEALYDGEIGYYEYYPIKRESELVTKDKLMLDCRIKRPD